MRWVAAVLAILGFIVADIWFDIDYEVAANTAIVVMAAIVTAFAALYALRSKWRSNRIGRIYLTKSLILAAVLWQIVAAVWINTEYPGRQHIRFAIYALGALAYLLMLASLRREQARDRRERDNPKV